MSQTLDELKFEIEGGNISNSSQANRSSLPKIPKQSSGSKFSSWNIETDVVQNSGPKKDGKGSSQEFNADFMDEVDELLLEQELLSPTAADKTIKSISSRQKLVVHQSNKENMKGKENEKVDIAVKKNITQSPELNSSDMPSKKRQQIEKLRDSTLEKLLNGEKDLGDLDIDGIEEMSPADKQTLRKKLSNSLNKKKDAKQNGQQQNDIDEFIMQDISDDLNQLLDNYDDILQPGKSSKGKKEANGGSAAKKPFLTQQGKAPTEFDGAARAASAAVIKDNVPQKVEEEDSWVLSPLKNQKLNSNSQLNNKNLNKDFKNFSTLKEPEANDIDSLVEEELSRNQSEDCSVEDEFEDGRPTAADGRALLSSKHASPAASAPGDGKQNGSGSNQKGKKITDANAIRGQPMGGNYASVPAKKGLFGAAQQRRSSLEHEQQDGKADDSLGSSSGKESQMFKDLFQATNKSKGIAGIQNVKISSKGSGVIHDEGAAVADLDLSMNGGPKLVSSKKTEELQMLAQLNQLQQVSSANERQLNKNRSKKDLKNKFKSSSAIYNDGVKASEPEDEDDIKGDADAKNISEIIQRHIQKEEAEKERAEKGGSSYPLPAGLSAGSGILANNLDAIKNGKPAYQIDDSEIDEIIKQHLIEEEQSVAKEKLKVKKKKSKGAKKKSSTEVDADKEKKEASTQPEDEIDHEENTNSGDDDYDDDELDQHGDDDDEIDDETEGLKAKKRSPTDDDEDDPYDFLDDSLNLNVKSPKLTLIEHLRLLADIFNSSLDEASEYYDQIFDERAQFMLDFENILKIMTFDETVEFVLPCMQIYSSEQDYLKLKLFQNLEKLFKKLFKAEVFIPKSEIIDIITINIFPLASRMLMLSEEPVQVEGVEALLNLSKQYIPKDQAQNLVLKVIQVIMDRISPQSEHQESEEVKEKAKIAILIIVQKFADADVFEKEQCQNFLDNHLEDIQDGMLFKIKKFVMPALIAVSKHLAQDVFIEQVYKATFQQFNNDEIWGVRKVCIENLASLMKYLPHDDVPRITECIEFFKRCLNDANRWVKNQALIQFGPIVHQIFLKIEQVPDANKDSSVAQLKEQINQMCLSYYDLKLIFGDKDDLDNSLMEKLDDYSFMQNKTDDVDKVKYYWAYNLPCALMVNGRSIFWFSHMKHIYEMLYKDVLINLRTTIAASFKEIIEILEIDKMDKQEERQFFVTVLNHFLKDTEEISAKVLPTICKLISKFPEDEKTELLDNLVRTKIESIKTMKNGRDTMVRMLEQLFDMFAPAQLLDANYHDYLFDIIKNERAIKYKLRAAQVIGSKIVSPLIKGKKYRALLTNFTDELRQSKHFRDRQIYIQIAASTYESDNEIFKKHFAKNIAQDLEQEPCRCVQISLAKLCNTVKEGYSKSLDKIRQKLLADDETTVIQYMPQSSQKASQSEQDRRFLALNYGDEKNGVDNDKQMTEEEWLEKERKEIQEVEKTVTIRFANYSTLMRAQTLTQGLSAQLAVFLSSMGVSNSSASQSPANTLLQKAAAAKHAKAGADLNQKLLDKAAASDKDMQDQKNAKLRSLSPLGILDDDKDAKLDQMLDDKQAKGDGEHGELEEQDNTDKDCKSIENGKRQDANDGDKTIQELENLEKL